MSIFWIALALIVTVFIHEFAHMIVMKRNGFKIDKFALGIPINSLPSLKLWKDRDGTDYIISPLLLGGGVIMNPEEEQKIDEASLWVKAQICLSGMLANVLLASALFSIIFFIKFQGADILIRILWSLLYGFGISFGFWIFGIPLSIWMILTGQVAVSGGIVGPIGIAQMMHSYYLMGVAQFLFIIAVLNVSLAAFNLIPLPPLDGGLLFRTVLEKYFPRHKKLINIFSAVGFMIIILLMVLVIGNDLWKLFIK